MIDLKQIEEDLKQAMKIKDAVALGTLRGLKTRVQNEQVAKISRGAGSASGGRETLTEDEIFALVKSEIKKRKEAAESFKAGGRSDAYEKELAEVKILEKYMPTQLSEEEIGKMAEEIVSANSFTAQDFGKAMGMLKAKVGNTADGALVAKILKERLK